LADPTDGVDEVLHALVARDLGDALAPALLASTPASQVFWTENTPQAPRPRARATPRR
jgi:hypothetical protein